MAEIIGLIVIGLLAYVGYRTSDQYRSDKRVSPPGYHHDWDASNRDLTLYGKDYYNRQNLAGKYDLPNHPMDGKKGNNKK